MHFEIKNRFTGEVQYSCELEAEFAGKSYSIQLGAAVKVAHKSDANLRGADLSGANLSGANLSGAYLRGAYLSGADLRDANLSDAYLSGADLRDAYLSGADLRGANLSGAYLSGANLSGADLRDANLRGADLSGANLSDANLSGAYLRGAYLSDADLSGADMETARTDFFDVLLRAKDEVLGLIQALKEGRVDGSTYQGECACLVGTIANVKHCNYDAIPNLKPDSNRPAEVFFTAIRKGDTPDKNPAAKLAIEWAEEFQELVKR
jgi:hypothetical protein